MCLSSPWVPPVTQQLIVRHLTSLGIHKLYNSDLYSNNTLYVTILRP